jgi:hypothetical protein
MQANTWSEWHLFPDPRQRGILHAPFGAGCYELRHRTDGRLILFGGGGNCAFRMSSLLPYPAGCGSRDNDAKRDYVLQNLANVEYRTLACADVKEAMECELELKRNRAAYIFRT